MSNQEYSIKSFTSYRAIVLTIALISICVYISCNQPKPMGANEAIKNNIEISNVDVSPSDSIIYGTAIVGMDTVPFRLDGKFVWSKDYDGHEYPLQVKEVYPGVVTIQKYMEAVRTDTRSGEPMHIEFPIVDEIRFYNKKTKEHKSVNLDDVNPFLKDSPIPVKQHGYDGEAVHYTPRGEADTITTLQAIHVTQTVNQQDQFTKIRYSKTEISTSYRIISQSTAMLIYDQQGDLIYRYITDANASTPVVSRNGQFLIYAIFPIETMSNAGIKTQTEGFQLRRVKDNKILFEEYNDDPDMWIAEPVISPNERFIYQAYSYPNSADLISKQYVFDPVDYRLYATIVTTETRQKYKYGVDYRTQDDLFKLYDYEEIAISPLN